MENKKEYVANFNDSDIWCDISEMFDSVEDAVETAKQINRDDYCGEYTGVYVGVANYYEPRIDGEDILERLTNDAYDDCGEASFEWDIFSLTNKEEIKDLSEELTKTLCEWLNKYNHYPNFSCVEDVKRIEF